MADDVKNKDRLDVLRAKYATQIQAKEEEIKALRARLLDINELIAEADGGYLLPASEMVATARPQSGGVGLTPAVLAAVNSLNRLCSPPDVRAYLISTGYPSSAKNFAVMIGSTLRRLAEQGKILSEKTDRGTAYKPKPL